MSSARTAPWDKSASSQLSKGDLAFAVIQSLELRRFPAAADVLRVLISLSRSEDFVCYAGRDAICEWSNRGSSAVKAALVKLEKMGAIRRRKLADLPESVRRNLPKMDGRRVVTVIQRSWLFEEMLRSRDAERSVPDGLAPRCGRGEIGSDGPTISQPGMRSGGPTISDRKQWSGGPAELRSGGPTTNIEGTQRGAVEAARLKAAGWPDEDVDAAMRNEDDERTGATNAA